MKVDLEKCTGCGDCLDACDNKAISLVANKAVIDLDTCVDCGACAEACPVGAISQVELSLPVKVAPAYPVKVHQIAPLELSATRKLTLWAGAALAYTGREIVPRVVEVLITALERKLSQPTNLPARIPWQSQPQGRSEPVRVHRRRRRMGWRLKRSSNDRKLRQRTGKVKLDPFQERKSTR